ncbi:MAG TPA: hypothetical protein VJP78_06535 [Thermoleophilia bacterium]|nr:hypothetical protein [Thermoleophilia bacterium]
MAEDTLQDFLTKREQERVHKCRCAFGRFPQQEQDQIILAVEGGVRRWRDMSEWLEARGCHLSDASLRQHFERHHKGGEALSRSQG